MVYRTSVWPLLSSRLAASPAHIVSGRLLAIIPAFADINTAAVSVISTPAQAWLVPRTVKICAPGCRVFVGILKTRAVPFPVKESE